MKYPRVNLLSKNEIRYQGAVSGRFILISAVASPIVIVLLVLGLKIIQHNKVQSELKKSRVTWATLQPQYESYKAESKDLGQSRGMVEMFNGWTKGQLLFSELLTEIQLAVPGNIQLSRLSVRSQSTATSYLKPEEMQLAFSLVVEGQSLGASAEQHVFGMQRNLLGGKQVSLNFGSLEPAYIRKRESSTGGSLREFRLEGSSAGGVK